MDIRQIKERMEVVGADGVHVGVIDRIDADRIKLAKKDKHGEHDTHRYLPLSLAADIEGDRLRLSANGAVAVEMFEFDA
jgi:hypothetical protein